MQKEGVANQDFNEIGNMIKIVLKKNDIFLTPETNLFSIGFDSFTFIKLLVKLEDFYNTEFEIIETKVNLNTLLTIENLIDLKSKLIDN